jgi:iron complex transport system substrate-binding protein
MRSMRAHQLLVAGMLFLASCGGSASPSAASQSTHFPVTLTGTTGVSVTITQQPHRIVSLSPTATEMLFAIGAGSQVVAVDDQSNYPAAAPHTKLSGFQPNIEAIAAYMPDLVVAADDIGGLVHGLQAVSIPILIEGPAKTIDDSYTQTEQLGTATGQRAGADSVVSREKADVASIVATLAKPSRTLKVYHELDNTYYTATSATFIGQVYKVLGLSNIADAATGAAPDYPQLSAEYIVSSNPDLIVLADTNCCQQDRSTVAARPGWSVIAAVKSGEVINVDDDIASRWGPRMIDLLRVVAPHVRDIGKQAT